MSKNYELLRKSGRAQRVFATILQESAKMTSGIFTTSHSARAEIALRQDGQPFSNDVGSPAGSSSCELPGTQCVEETSRRVEQASSSPATALTEFLGRAKATLRPTGGSLKSMRHATNYPRLRSAHELALLAHEEQVKLMQQIFLTGDKRAQVVVFCGVESGNGCSRVCAESAVTLAAQVSGTVCLIDADLRSPTLDRIFGLKNGKGFTEAMLHFAPIREYGHQLGNLWIMTSGAPPQDPHVLLTSETFRLRMKELREDFDFVLIDAPPINPFADVTRLGLLADGVILVVKANSTRREAARKAAQDLRAANAKVLAAILNRRTYPIPEPIYRRL